jgi:hypothetical protein
MWTGNPSSPSSSCSWKAKTDLISAGVHGSILYARIGDTGLSLCASITKCAWEEGGDDAWVMAKTYCFEPGFRTAPCGRPDYGLPFLALAQFDSVRLDSSILVGSCFQFDLPAVWRKVRIRLGQPRFPSLVVRNMPTDLLVGFSIYRLVGRFCPHTTQARFRLRFRPLARLSPSAEGCLGSK